MDRKSDTDTDETREWLDALEAVLEREGPERAHYLLERLIDKARRSGAYLPYSANTAYINTIPLHLQEPIPGDQAMERRLRSLVRWNAIAMVVKANREHAGLGGHIATFASAATLLDVGMNHFFRAPGKDHDGDLVFFQGHCAPGVYARAYLEGRIDKDRLHNFRQEVDGKGLSSYPHPWLMPDFLAISHGFHGPDFHDGDRPGALHAVSQAPRSQEYPGSKGLGVSRRWRDG